MVALEWRQSSGGEASGIEIHIGGGIGMPPATSFASPPCPVVPRNPEKGGGASRVHYLSDHPLPFSHSPYQTIRDSAPGVLHSGKKPDLR
ncbi:hypothetical protein JEQ12_004004 [Ovis aries]|uniref:Uncharacterized protein n=1 Tax=Ovis aries TaxID=9940 RepID=A0A836A7D3_SHEEP|nr:hypothetical protein JEQ12_004004 [Ovis aries]